jgi:hypothetical protein
MAVAFTARANAPQRDRARFAAMISESVLSRSQLEAAQRSALARNADIEDVLLDEMGIKIGLVGRALADFFGVPYFTFQIDRRRPPGLLDNFNYEFVVQNQWMPIEEGRNGLFVLAVDPDRLKASGAVARIFPNAVPVYCVTTRREFGWMVSQFFGDGAVEATVPPAAAMPALPDVSQTIIANTVSHLVQGALREGITELHIETMPGKDATEVRFQVTGVIKLPPK